MTVKTKTENRVSPRIIAELRQKKRMPIVSVAKKAGISAKQLGRIEKSREETVAVQERTKMGLARALEVEPRELCGKSIPHVDPRTRVAAKVRLGRRRRDEMARKVRDLENLETRLSGQIRRARCRRDRIAGQIRRGRRQRDQIAREVEALQEQLQSTRIELDHVIVDAPAKYGTGTHPRRQTPASGGEEPAQREAGASARVVSDPPAEQGTPFVRWFSRGTLPAYVASASAVAFVAGAVATMLLATPLPHRDTVVSQGDSAANPIVTALEQFWINTFLHDQRILDAAGKRVPFGTLELEPDSGDVPVPPYPDIVFAAQPWSTFTPEMRQMRPDLCAARMAAAGEALDDCANHPCSGSAGAAHQPFSAGKVDILNYTAAGGTVCENNKVFEVKSMSM